MAGLSFWVNMNVANLHDVSEPNEEAWEYYESVTNDTGHAIIIPAGCEHIGVTVKWTSGTYVVRTTTNLLNTVKTDMANCTWIDWDLGTGLVANAQDEVDSCVTAIVLVATGGTAEIYVNAK